MTEPQLVRTLPGVALDEMVALAELRVRTDRKYIVDDETLAQLLESQADTVAILDIDARREFNYETVYFDTANLDLYRAAATGRRRRFKVRTRVYVASDVAVLEVKLKDGRGRTVKKGFDYSPVNRERLTREGAAFVEELVGRPGLAATLQPVLTTRYRRMTIVDRAAQSRATIDRGLVCTDKEGRTVAMGDVIIESKSDLAASPIDRWLWRRGYRPIRISKCCTSMAAMQPDLPSNKWHRTLKRHFPQPQSAFS
ncbi:MAG: molecular chaperone [Actinobacteria bacterium]|nr:MAG: molecular chaperone [Actinomycetota bacterium]